MPKCNLVSVFCGSVCLTLLRYPLDNAWQMRLSVNIMMRWREVDAMFAGSLSLWFCSITEEWLTRGQWCEAAIYLLARKMPCYFVCREQTIV